MSNCTRPRWTPPRARFAVGFFAIGVITTIGVQKFNAARPSARCCESSMEDINSSNEPVPERGPARGGGPPWTRGGLGGFATLKLVSTQDVNHNTKRLRFEVPESSSLGKFTLSSAVLTFHKPAGALFPVIRPYTPIQRFNDPQHIEVLVKKYPDGKASTYIHSLKVGDSLKVRGPVHPYSWKTNETKNLNLIAGGSGITPLYQLIQGILLNPDERTNIKLIFAVNSESDMVLKDEISAFQKRFPEQFQVAWTISNPSSSDSPYHNGHVDKQFLEKELLGKVNDGKMESKIFLCGPPAMEASLAGKKGWMWNERGLLEELGYSRNQIFKF